MRPPETRRYLNEIRRVLKPNGKAVVTFFVLPKDPRCARYGRRPFLPVASIEGAWTLAPELPERGIGFSPKLIAELIEDGSLNTKSWVRGYWHAPVSAEAPHCWSHQDTLVLCPKPL